MPPEIIDLVSSPWDARAPASRAGAPAQRHQTLSSPRLNCDALGSSDDAFDPFSQKYRPRASIRGVQAAKRRPGLDWDRNESPVDLVYDLSAEDRAEASESSKNRRPVKRARYSHDSDNGTAFSNPGSRGAASATLNPKPSLPSRASRVAQAVRHFDLTSSSPRENPAAPLGVLLGSDPFETPISAGGRGPVRPTSPTRRAEQIDPFPSSPQQNARLPRKSLAWDPISSSAPESSAREKPKPRPRNDLSRSRSEVITLDDSEDEGDEDDEDDEQSRASSETQTDEELPEVGSTEFTKARPQTSRAKAKAVAAANGGPSKRPLAKSKVYAKQSVEERTREKERKKASTEAEREQKRLEKEAEKEQKRLEKERAKEEKAKAAALAEVNKIRTDKRISAPEMIVDLPSTLDASLRLQVQTLLDGLDIAHHAWDSPVPDVVKWRRKVDREYNEALGHYEPIRQRIDDEAHVMVLLDADDFVRLALGADGADLEAHVLQMKTHFPGHTLVYLIEGFTLWMRKNRNLRNRQFASAVRGAGDDPSDAARRPAQLPRARVVDEDVVEDALLGLQVRHGALIHHTGAAVESAQWVAVFTQQLSTAPYRRQREAANDAGAAFCMDAGQVRAGDGAGDTYVRLLQEITRVSAPVAYGVAAEFPALPALLRGLLAGGPLALEDIPKGANKDGAVSDRTIGPAISRRLYKVFTGRDETSREI